MAPEMLQRRGDARSDVYSLGIVLFECLYGDVPFRGDSEWEVLRKHEVAEPEFPPQAEERDRTVILRCLQKQPEHRFASVAELLRALQAPVALGESLVWRAPKAGGVVEGPPGTASRVEDRRQPPPLPHGVATEPVDGFEVALDDAPKPTRDPADSPYGMPWQPAAVRPGPFGLMVRLIFRLIEAMLFVVLLPVRATSAFAGRGIVALLRLPLQLLSFAARVVGLLLVLGIVALVVVTVLALVAAA
jgi:hypothetical protein